MITDWSDWLDRLGPADVKGPVRCADSSKMDKKEKAKEAAWKMETTIKKTNKTTASCWQSLEGDPQSFWVTLKEEEKSGKTRCTRWIHMYIYCISNVWLQSVLFSTQRGGITYASLTFSGAAASSWRTAETEQTWRSNQRRYRKHARRPECQRPRPQRHKHWWNSAPKKKKKNHFTLCGFHQTLPCSLPPVMYIFIQIMC